MLALFLKVLALVLFILAGLNVAGPRFAPVALGLASWLASDMVPGGCC